VRLDLWRGLDYPKGVPTNSTKGYVHRAVSCITLGA